MLQVVMNGGFDFVKGTDHFFLEVGRGTKVLKKVVCKTKKAQMNCCRHEEEEIDSLMTIDSQSFIS